MPRIPRAMLRSGHGDRTGTHLSQRAAGARAPTNGRLSADDPATRDQSTDVDRDRESRARGRSPHLSHPADQRQGRTGGRRPAHHRHDWRHPADGEGPERRRPRPRRRADARESGPDHQDRRRVARDGLPRTRTRRQVAGDRRIRAAAARADRSGAVARDRPVAGAARPRRRDRRSAAARLPAVQPPRHEAGGEAADPRAERAQRQARSGVQRARPRDRPARDEEQDRVGRAAGDDRRAAAVLPAPAAQGDSGRARRRREDRSSASCARAWRPRSCPRRSPPSRRRRSSGSSGCRRRRPSTR